MCAAVLGTGAALPAADNPRPGRTGQRRRSACPRCGHPQRLHRPVADGHEPVVGAPLPVDLPGDVLAGAPVARDDPPEPDPVRTPVPTPGLVEAAVGPDSPSTDAPPGDSDDAGDGDGFVERIRELAELYRTGALDDEEFAAAKAIVLRSPNR